MRPRLPRVQRPHTHGHSHTRSVTHTCLIHTHTRGGTHPRCFTHPWGFTHTCRFSRARGFSQLRCPFHTRRAGKHARRHTCDHTTRTLGLILTRGFFLTRGHTCTRGLIHTRGRFHTRPFTPGMCELPTSRLLIPNPYSLSFLPLLTQPKQTLLLTG